MTHWFAVASESHLHDLKNIDGLILQPLNLYMKCVTHVSWLNQET